MFVVESNKFADSLLNQAVDAAFCINESGYFLYVNNAMCHLTGYSREQLMEMSLFDIDVKTLLSDWLKVWQEIKQHSVTLASQFRCESSQLVPVEIVISYAEGNDAPFACGYVRHPNIVTQPVSNNYDISSEFSSEYRKKHLELETSLALLRSTLESSVNGVLAVNFEGEVLCCNQKYMDMWRLPKEVRLTKSCERAKAFFESQVKHPEVFFSCVWEMPLEIDSERYDLIELKDGRIFAHYSEPYRLDGKIIGRVWSVWDITESQQTEQALRINEARFRSLAETNQASIFLIKGSHLCYANPAAEILTGYTIEQMLSLISLDTLFKSKRLRQVSKDNGSASEYQEIQIVTSSGVERWLACTVTLTNGVFDFNNEHVELITAIDITDYKQAESEVLLALEQAKQLSELRERFVSMLCHQFRTPLNIVSFSADLLRRHIHQWNEEKNRSYIDLILTAVEQLGHLLDDILLYGKADAAKLEFYPRTLELDKFCRDIAIQVQLADGNQKLIDVINKDNISNACLDPKLLQHILNNLLSNAIKYSPNGGTVTLELTRESQSQSQSQSQSIRFRVSDTGIGIPGIDRPHVFEPFYRGNNIDSIPGSGLGLSIVKTLVELHCGEITFDSQVGVGTTFVVTLPSK
ncbi:PAS/PAC sensor signal transduction histidine kinase [Calothrix sp. NIES-4071]|nr:PAS/PAC sensor signal transduction histidine kinase [Calothrix sp. NIES-4071]BAZ59998.1 PAS/PAC sensor signal transduction histidine kinase [Calothrix sp. NIES-4105]